MACEDFPCCGHERGCCPDYDGAGRQLNMRCTCGAVVPIDNRSSICDGCLNSGEDDGFDNPFFDDEDDEDGEDSLYGDDFDGYEDRGDFWGDE